MSVALSILILIAIGYGLVWFPIAALVACARTSTADGRARTGWLISLILFVPLSSWAYALFTPNRGRMRVSAVFSIAVTVMLVVFAVRFSSLKADEARSMLEALSASVSSADLGVTPDNRRELLADLTTLGAGVSGGILALDRTAVAFEFGSLLNAVVEDHEVSAAEVETWRAQFRDRGNRGMLIERSIRTAQTLIATAK